MSEPAIYPIPFSEDEERAAWRQNVVNLHGAVQSILHKAGIRVVPRGNGLTVLHDQCFLDSDHRVDPTNDDTPPDFQRMVIRGNYLWCPIGKHKITAAQILNIMPLGKRKSVANQDAFLHKFNCPPELWQGYAFESGDNFEVQHLDADPAVALEMVRPSPKQQLRGCVIKAPTERQAREALKEHRDDLPWRELHGKLREDGSLDANWHGAPLTLQEQTALKTQEIAALHEARRQRAKVVARLRREADALSIGEL